MNNHLRNLSDPVSIAHHVLSVGLISVADKDQFIEVYSKIMGAHLDISNIGLRARLMDVLMDALVANNPLSGERRFMETLRVKLQDLSYDTLYSTRARHYSRALI